MAEDADNVKRYKIPNQPALEAALNHLAEKVEKALKTTRMNFGGNLIGHQDDDGITVEAFGEEAQEGVISYDPFYPFLDINGIETYAYFQPGMFENHFPKVSHRGGDLVSMSGDAEPEEDGVQWPRLAITGTGVVYIECDRIASNGRASGTDCEMKFAESLPTNTSDKAYIHIHDVFRFVSDGQGSLVFSRGARTNLSHILDFGEIVLVRW